ncbi:hypothetical protein ACFSHQ_17910 [Gemmobacter lanyuensis]
MSKAPAGKKGAVMMTTGIMARMAAVMAVAAMTTMAEAATARRRGSSPLRIWPRF